MSVCYAQQSKRVLFVGNSYTYYNNLPTMIANMAESVGDQLIHTRNTPGGCRFEQHCSNQSMQLINQGGWDIVVLQEQSQLPSFPQWQVETDVFPYATQLVNAIYAASPCAEPMFYMTWGRRDGDRTNAEEFPVLGTYEGMDSMLYERYMFMAQANDASVSPVGRVWRKLRTDHPEIELYNSDGSHPSLAGSYAAACTFFAMMFHHDPIEISFDDDLDENVARTIRQAASQIVWSSDTSLPQSQWTRPLPHAYFQAIADSSNQQFDNSTPQQFNNLSTHADSLFWSFGDDTFLATSGDIDSVLHAYADTGYYTITLVASRHCMYDTASINLHVCFNTVDTSTTDTTGTDPDTPVGFNSHHTNKYLTTKQFHIFPSPTSGIVYIVGRNSVEGTPVKATLLNSHGQTVNQTSFQSDNNTLSQPQVSDAALKLKNLSAYQFSLDLQSLPSGIYILSLQQGETTEIHKVVKK